MICNNGYTIERYIHGWDEGYNDIQPWDIKGLPTVFGAKDQYKGYKVTTRDELRQLFANEEFASAPFLQVGSLLWDFFGVPKVLTRTIQLVELHMPRDDAPAALKITAEAAATRNK